jgi:hypothetical protein
LRFCAMIFRPVWRLLDAPTPPVAMGHSLT